MLSASSHKGFGPAATRAANPIPQDLRTARPQPIVCYAPNAVIYRQGDPAGALYQIEYGSVRLYRLLADGRRQIDSFHFAGETFGLSARGQHSFFAEAIEQSAVRRLDTPHRAGGTLELSLIALDRAQAHMSLLGCQGAVERLGRFLADLDRRQHHPAVLTLAMPRADIADYLGLTIETVSRAFTRMRELGLISLQSARAVAIVNRAALLDLEA